MRHNVSEIIKNIEDRRTIKPEQFSARKVHQELVEIIMNSAKWAPTHGLTQPWYFKVFVKAGIKRLATFQSERYKERTPHDKFVEAKYEKLRKRPMMASAVIAICMRRQETEKIPEVEEVESVACAVQNMYLTASAYGLAAYWGTGGLTYTDEMKEFLGLGVRDKCLGFFYLGYPAIAWPKGQRRPLEYYTDWVDS